MSVLIEYMDERREWVVKHRAKVARMRLIKHIVSYAIWACIAGAIAVHYNTTLNELFRSLIR